MPLMAPIERTPHAKNVLFFALFGASSRLSAHRADNPSKSELLGALADGQKRLTDALRAMTGADLVQPLPDERYRHLFPTVGSTALHVLTVHAAVHIGQLSAWRRAMGLPPVADPM